MATGNIRGTVTDASGGVLTQCPVTITNTDTGLRRAVATNERGDFNAPSMPLGGYQISVEKTGFQKKTLTGIVLQVTRPSRSRSCSIPAPSPRPSK